MSFEPFGAALLLLLSLPARPQGAIDLASVGVPVAANRHCDPKLNGEPVSITGISYVGDDLLLITYVPPCTYIQSGNPIPYTALLIDHTGKQRGRISVVGTLNDIHQIAINAQPLDHVILRTGHDLRTYDTTLQQAASISLPDRAEVSLTPDRKRVAVFATAGAEAEVAVATVGDALPPPRHLAFNELAVRNREIAISNAGDVAHAVPEPDPELGVLSASNAWPRSIPSGKYHVPLAFVSDDSLLLSITGTKPFPPANLDLWNRSGAIHEIAGSSAASFSRPQVSLDGSRLLISKTKDNFLRELLGGFDCGLCGESYSYLFVDISSRKVLKQLRPNWRCEDALSPSGHEIAELCGQTLRFYAAP